MVEETPKTNIQSRIVVIRKRASEIWWILPIMCAAGALVAGIYFYVHLPGKINEENRDDLLSRIETIGTLTNSEDVAVLTGTKLDLNSEAYIRTKKNLYNVHNVSSGARFVYYMRLNQDGNFSFLVDSESPGSRYATFPGQINTKVSKDEMTNLLDAVAYTKGPYKDELGTWVTGYAPVWYSGRLVGIAGIDIDATGWVNQIKEYRQNIAEITLLIVFVFTLFGLHIRRLIFSYSTRG
jgi:hypothetical protein